MSASSCPDTCSGQGLLTCANLECASSADQCGTCESAGLRSCYDGSCVMDPDQCPSCSSLGKVSCDSSIDGTKICADSVDLCPSPANDCAEAGLVLCERDGYSCAPTQNECPAPTCGGDQPVTCGGGVCAQRPEDCSGFHNSVDQYTCEQYGWVTCGDQTCAPGIDKCSTPSCAQFGMITCPDEHCEWSYGFCD